MFCESAPNAVPEFFLNAFLQSGTGGGFFFSLQNSNFLGLFFFPLSRHCIFLFLPAGVC